MIVVDSSVWIDFFGTGPRTPQVLRLREALRVERVVVGDLILTEVLQGFREDARYRAARERMLALRVETMGGERTSLAAADAYRNLRQRGITPRSTIDVLIACHCVRRGHALLQADRDFDLMAPVLGLRTA